MSEIPAFEVHDLTVRYRAKPVLWSVDFTLPEGALACVLGPNGAGKSTLVKAALGLVRADSGFVKVFGQSLDEVRKQVSYVPQKEAVDWDFPITVEEVVMMGRFSSFGMFRRPSAQDREAVAHAIEKVGIGALRKRNIKALSGGQQQRVFIARALAQQAQFYFMDEPFAGVDKATEETIINLLKELSAEGVTCLVVHHDLPTVQRYFDTAILLNTSLVAAGPVEEVMTEANLKSTFGGKLNILSSVISNIETEDMPPRHTQ